MSPLQEAIVRTWGWYLGHCHPQLIPTETLERSSQPEQMDEENKEEETDADICKRDVILVCAAQK